MNQKEQIRTVQYDQSNLGMQQQQQQQQQQAAPSTVTLQQTTTGQQQQAAAEQAARRASNVYNDSNPAMISNHYNPALIQNQSFNQNQPNIQTGINQVNKQIKQLLATNTLYFSTTLIK